MFCIPCDLGRILARHFGFAKSKVTVRTATPETKLVRIETVTKCEEAGVPPAAESMKYQGKLFDTPAAVHCGIDDIIVATQPGGIDGVFVPNKALLDGFKSSNIRASMGELGSLFTKAT